MKFENSLNPEVKNLKNYFDSDNHSSVLMKNPRLVASGYLMDDPDWSSAPHVHDFVELIFVLVGMAVLRFIIRIMKLNLVI